MLSNATLAKGLAVLQAAFPRDVTEDAIAAYRLALSDLTPGQLETAVGLCLRECRFFPAPAEIRERAGLNKATAVDTEKLLAGISALGSYNPTVGWIYPRVDAVRERYGQAVGAAYGMAGASRCFSDNEISRDIARRVFSEELQGSRQQELPAEFIIGSHTAHKMLTTGVGDDE